MSFLPRLAWAGEFFDGAILKLRMCNLLDRGLKLFRLVGADAIDFSVFHGELNRVKAGDIKNPHIWPEPQSDVPAVIPMIFYFPDSRDFAYRKIFAENAPAKTDFQKLFVNEYGER